ncbi:MAG: 4-hydroxy-tetrahydrodipicolinate reductase [Ginsengibacter sp.]
MNIALIGYGKMGKAIEEIALQRGHSICLKITSQNTHDLTPNNLKKADAAIEFSNPKTAVINLASCMKAGIPVVCGTTGWLKDLHYIETLCKEQNGSFLFSSNFSVGVNIFFEINNKLASLMDPREDYKVSIEETHHTQKKDAPSGTAISLAEGIINNLKRKIKWVNGGDAMPGELGIISHRVDDVPGTHKVIYHSEIDDVEIIHTAHNRRGFAYGAVLAVEYLASRKGIFTMKNVLGI